MAVDTALRDLLHRLARVPAEGRAPTSQQEDALLDALAGVLETAVDALDVGRDCPDGKQAPALLDVVISFGCFPAKVSGVVLETFFLRVMALTSVPRALSLNTGHVVSSFDGPTSLTIPRGSCRA